MFRLISSVTAPFGAAKATALIKLNTFEGQRKANTKWVKQLIGMMKAGTFVKGNVAVANWNGQSLLMNGQHQLAALIEHDQPVKMTLDNYDCDTYQDVASLFGTFDVGKGRTETQIVTASRVTFQHEGMRELPLRFLTTFGSAMWMVAAGKPYNIVRASPTKTTKVELLIKHAEDAMAVYSLIERAERTSKIPHVATLAAMYLTWKKSPDRAATFWIPVLANDGLSKGSAQWFCQKAISGSHRTRLDTFGNLCRCISWWNTWVTGADRKSVKTAVMRDVPDVEG